jgi:nucleolar protein 14
MGGKGSQLSQLKSALSQAGFTRSAQDGKKRKRSNIQEHDKEKRATKLDDIHRRLNPFDVKVTKLKHDVGGRKLKGVVGRPAQSKQIGLEQVWFIWPSIPFVSLRYFLQYAIRGEGRC